MPKPIRYDGSELDPRVSPFNEVLANLVSLNEAVTSLYAGLAAGEKVDPQFAEMLEGVLRDHSFRLGFQFFGERPDAAWFARDEAEQNESIRKQLEGE
jgi:hypothetical protein